MQLTVRDEGMLKAHISLILQLWSKRTILSLGTSEAVSNIFHLVYDRFSGGDYVKLYVAICRLPLNFFRSKLYRAKCTLPAGIDADDIVYNKKNGVLVSEIAHWAQISGTDMYLLRWNTSDSCSIGPTLGLEVVELENLQAGGGNIQAVEAIASLLSQRWILRLPSEELYFWTRNSTDVIFNMAKLRPYEDKDLKWPVCLDILHF